MKKAAAAFINNDDVFCGSVFNIMKKDFTQKENKQKNVCESRMPLKLIKLRRVNNKKQKVSEKC